MTWASVNCINNSSASGIYQELLSNNKFICIESRLVYNQNLIEHAFITVWDLFKQLCYLQHAHLSPIDSYFLFTLFNAILEGWHRMLKTNENAALLNDCYVDLDSFSLHFGREKLDVKKS